MFSAKATAISALVEDELHDVWWGIEEDFKDQPYETLVNYFIEAIKYGMEQKLIWPYQYDHGIKIPYQGTSEYFAIMLKNYMPKTYAELKEIRPLIHLLQFDFPYHDSLKPYPSGEGLRYSMDYTFTLKEWKVIEKLTIATFEQPTAKDLLECCEAIIGNYSNFDSFNIFRKWYYLCTQRNLFWPQATEQGFSPAPRSTEWLESIIALLKQYKTADQIPQETIEYPYIQWFVEEKPIEWIKFELKGRLKIMD